uniref:Leucine-rich repeat-containing N-terminal plant-type domain-containing protein n=2 Tax=Grammatophora oceanica TaxID=210454 RepID=A0A7S1VKF4_9STRA
MREFDNPGGGGKAAARASPPVVEAPKPKRETYEERFARKLLEDEASRQRVGAFSTSSSSDQQRKGGPRMSPPVDAPKPGNGGASQSYEDRMARKMAADVDSKRVGAYSSQSSEDPSNLKQQPRLAPRVEAPNPHLESLEERMNKKMAEDAESRRVGAYRSSSEDPANRKQPRIADHRDAPNPNGDSLEERMARKMAADADTRVGAHRSSSSADPANRKQPRVAEHIEAPIPNGNSESLQVRMERKMAADADARVGAHRSSSADPADRKQPRIAEHVDAPNPNGTNSMEDRMARKMAADAATSHRVGARYTSSYTDPALRKEAPRLAAGLEPPAPANASYDERMERKMHASLNSIGGPAQRRWSGPSFAPTVDSNHPQDAWDRKVTADFASQSEYNSNENSYHSRMSMDDHIQRQVGRDQRRRGSRGLRGSSQFGTSPNPGEYLLDMPSEGSLDVPRDIGLGGGFRTVSRNSSRSALTSSAPPTPTSRAGIPPGGFHSAGPNGHRLRPPDSVSKSAPPRISGGPTPGAYQMDGRAIGALPSWGRNFRRQLSNRFQRRRPSRTGQSRREFEPSLPTLDHSGPGDSHVPPELRGSSSEFHNSSNIPPELRGSSSNIPPELRGSSAMGMGMSLTDLPNGFMHDQELDGRQESYIQDDDVDVLEPPKEGGCSRTTWIILGIIMLLLAIGGGVGAGIALSGGGGSEGGPTPSPTVATDPEVVGPPSAAPSFVSCNEEQSDSFPILVTSCACEGEMQWGEDAVPPFLDMCLQLTAELESVIPPQYMKCEFEGEEACSDINALAFSWLANDTMVTGITQANRLTNRLYLAHLFLTWSEGQPSRWGVNSWLTPSNECNWIGVTCDENSDIVELELRDILLEGTGDKDLGWAPTLWEMKKLQKLVMLETGLNAPSIPNSISGLSSLEQLTIIPHRIGRNLPNALFRLTNLKILELVGESDADNENRLEGVLPTAIENLAQLEQLVLQNTLIGGPIPTQLGSLTQLKELTLMNSSFNGSIPTTIGKISTLELLYLGRNNLDGTIPTELASLPALAKVDLYENNLSGEIPQPIGNGTLYCFEARGNAVEGTLDSEFCSANPTVYVPREVKCDCCRASNSENTACLN